MTLNNGNGTYNPRPENYPGWNPEEIAMARLAAIAKEIAVVERKAAPLDGHDEDPIAQALEQYAQIQDNGCAPEQAQVETILMFYFDAAGRAIAQQMGGDYDAQPDRFVALALLEYLNTRMTAAVPPPPGS